MRSLGQSLERLRDLLAWDQLKQSEARPNQPPAFQLYDPTATDLRNEYSSFLSTAVQMHTLLNRRSRSMTPSMRTRMKKRLAKLEQQVHQLNLDRRPLRY